ncbi:MAG: hypothetical protein JXR23_08670 [Pontiellaceae bacterium]|nr:hypothetical protein [Pontiellaceae bacterium]
MGVKIFFLALAASLAGLVSGYSESEQDTDISFGEIDRCAESMIAAESYRDALTAYKKAVAAGEHILSQYPASDVARALSSGERKIGGLSWAQFLELKEALELSAEAEQDLAACAQVIAETGEDESYKRNVLLNVAEYHANNKANVQAEQLLTKALEYVPAVTNAFSRAHTITRCAEVYHKMGDNERAASMRERAAEEITGIVVTSEWDSDRLLFGYMDLMIASFQAGEEGMGDRLLERTLRLIGETDELLRERGLYNLATSLAQVGYVDKALSIVQEMMQESYSSMFLRELMMGKYDDDQLVQLLTYVVSMGEGYERDESLTELAVRYAERGQLTQAVSIIRTWMSESFLADQAWGRIAEQCVKAGKFNQAVSCADQIEEMREKAVAFAAIAVACEEAGERELADELFLWAEVYIATERGFYFQISACCAVAEKYIDEGQDVRAAGLLSKAAIAVGAPGNFEYRSWGQCATIARLLFRIHQDEFAHELLSLSEQWVAEVEDEQRRVIFMRNIAEAYAQAGDLQAALGTPNSLEMDDIEMELVFKHYADYCSKNGETSLLLEALSAQKDQFNYRYKLWMLSDLGYVDAILKLAESAENARDRDRAVDEAVSVCMEKGRFFAAVEAAAIHDNPLDQAAAFVNIAALASEAEYEFSQDDLAVLSRIVHRAVPMDAFWKKQGFCTSAD